MPLSFDKTFDKTKAINARWARFDITPAGAGAATKVSCRMIDIDAKVMTSVLKQPGTDDLLRAVDEVATEAEETFLLVDVEEIELIWTLLGGVNGFVKGTAIGYAQAPGTASTKVRHTYPEFACTVRRPDGAIRIGGADWSKTSLLITNISGSPIVPTIDQDAPDGSA